MRLVTVRFAAIYQLASAAGFALSLALNWGTLDRLTELVFAALCGLNLVIGIALLRRVAWASYLGTANMALQVPALNSRPFSYVYTGVGEVFAFAKIDPESGTYLFGPSVSFSPGTFMFFMRAPFQGVEIYIGIIAALMTVCLARDCVARRP